MYPRFLRSADQIHATTLMMYFDFFPRSLKCIIDIILIQSFGASFQFQILIDSNYLPNVCIVSEH